MSMCGGREEVERGKNKTAVDVKEEGEEESEEEEEWGRRRRRKREIRG